jgi:hypothetical protein
VDRTRADGESQGDLPLPDRASVHLDCAYDSSTTRRGLPARWLVGEISQKGKPAAFKAGLRWVVERTNSCQAKLAHKKLVYGEEWASDRFLGDFLRCCDNPQATHPRRMESLPLGGSTFPTTMTN